MGFFELFRKYICSITLNQWIDDFILDSPQLKIINYCRFLLSCIGWKLYSDYDQLNNMDSVCVNCGEQFVYKNKKYNRQGLSTNLPKTDISVVSAIKLEWPNLTFTPRTVKTKFVCRSCVGKLVAINNKLRVLEETRTTFKALGEDKLWEHARVMSPRPVTSPPPKRQKVDERLEPTITATPTKSKKRKRPEQDTANTSKPVRGRKKGKET